MISINIPSQVLNGFKIIYNLNNEQLEKIVHYLSNLEIGTSYDVISKDLEQIIDNNFNGTELFRTILSFSKLIDEVEENEDTDYKEIAEGLTNKYFEINDNLPEENKSILFNNLFKILTNYKNLRYTAKIKETTLLNENNFSNCNLVTDIRLIFEDNSNDSKRHAVILHKLSLEYQNNLELKECHLTLNLEDLKKLKSSIDDAIFREDIIQKDYSMLNFIE